MNLYKVMATSRFGNGGTAGSTQSALAAWLAQQAALVPLSQLPQNLCTSFHPHSGIVNIGNTCYLNSALQMMARFSAHLTSDPNPAYLPGLKLLGDTVQKINNQSLTRGDVITLYDHFLAADVAGLNKFTPGSLHVQQDASEVLTKFLGLFKPSIGIQTSTTPLDGDYKGRTSSRIESQAIVDVPIAFKPSQTGLLSELILNEYGVGQDGEVMSGDNQFVPVERSPAVDAMKTHHLVPTNPEAGSSIVFFDLKRFTYNHQLKGREKISTPVSVDSQFVMQVGDAMVQFTLVGGIVHGGGAHGGHYWSFAQHDGQSGYTVFDDSTVVHVATADQIRGIDTGGYVFAYRMTPVLQSLA
jgi:hypothetical protein